MALQMQQRALGVCPWQLPMDNSLCILNIAPLVQPLLFWDGGGQITRGNRRKPYRADALDPPPGLHRERAAQGAGR